MIGRLGDIDIRLLRVFVAVVEAGGFSLAVARLNIAESTVSQHMSDLETRIGYRLCERGRGGFRLTEPGELVYRLAVELLARFEEFRDNVASIRSGLAGTLKLGLPDAIVTEKRYDFASRLSAYLERYPDVSLEIVMRSPRKLERAVFEGDLHIAVGPEHRRVSGLRFIPLYSERNSLYCGRNHPLFGVASERITQAEVARMDQIARGYLDRFDAQFFPEPRHRVIVHHVEAAALMILSGAGIGFLPDHHARGLVERGDLFAIKPDHYSFVSRMGVILPREYEKDLRASSLLDVLVEGIN
ncbi:MAG: LysR family transcriptional regulator [Pseudomonadota bacterium]